MFRGPLNKDFTFAFTIDYLTNSISDPQIYNGYLQKNQEIIVNQTYFYYFRSKTSIACSSNEIYDENK